MFDRPVFGWLPWSPRVSKKIFLSANELTISWPLMANTKKKCLKKFFRQKKYLKNLTLKCLSNFQENFIENIIFLQLFNKKGTSI